MEQYLVIKVWGQNKYIALDRNSGGYPYETDNPFQATLWHSKKEAVEYAKLFPNQKWVLAWLTVNVDREASL